MFHQNLDLWVPDGGKSKYWLDCNKGIQFWSAYGRKNVIAIKHAQDSLALLGTELCWYMDGLDRLGLLLLKLSHEVET